MRFWRPPLYQLSYTPIYKTILFCNMYYYNIPIFLCQVFFTKFLYPCKTSSCIRKGTIFSRKLCLSFLDNRPVVLRRIKPSLMARVGKTAQLLHAPFVLHKVEGGLQSTTGAGVPLNVRWIIKTAMSRSGQKSFLVYSITYISAKCKGLQQDF